MECIDYQICYNIHTDKNQIKVELGGTAYSNHRQLIRCDI